MMKRYFKIMALLAVIAAALSCNKKSKTVPIDGVWCLENIETRSAHIGDVEISVYMDLKAGKFDLYQKIGDGRYRHSNGSYVFSEGKFSGSYSDGTPLGSVYDVELDKDRLVLQTAGGHERDTYVRIDSIPEEVLDNTF